MAALNALNVTKLDSGRHRIYVARLVVNYSDVLGNSGNAIKGIWLPAGAILEKVNLIVITPFNSVTSDTLAIKTESDSATVLAASSIAAAGRFAASETNLGLEKSSPEYLDYVWTGVGTAPTAGQVAIHAHYILSQETGVNHGKDGVPPGIS